MRPLHWSLIALGTALALPSAAAAQVVTGSGDDYFDDYGAAVSEFYGTPVDRLPAYFDPDELPLVYLLAREAGVSPQIIIALRERGWSWIQITYELGVDPYLYVERLPHSTGYWRRYSRSELRYLSDRHIIDFVNLVFWADYHRRPIVQVIVIRQRVPTWRHYARYHAPPRTGVLGVYVRRTPARTTPYSSRTARSLPTSRSTYSTPTARSTPTTRSTTTRSTPPPRQAVPRQAVPRQTSTRDDAQPARQAVPRQTSTRDDAQRRAVSRDGRGSDDRSALPVRQSGGVSAPSRSPAARSSGAVRPAAQGSSRSGVSARPAPGNRAPREARPGG
jgi:hypothetical protein